jgi:hypothetical protein
MMVMSKAKRHEVLCKTPGVYMLSETLLIAVSGLLASCQVNHTDTTTTFSSAASPVSCH